MAQAQRASLQSPCFTLMLVEQRRPSTACWIDAVISVRFVPERERLIESRRLSARENRC